MLARRALTLLLALACLVGARPVSAQGIQVGKTQIKALVDALKGRPLTAQQHDLLVALGEEAEAGEDVLPGDLLYVGWALVAADRPDLGYDLVKRGLGTPPLLATDALRSMILSVDFGQDGLGRGIVELAETINPRAARRLQRSVDQPELLDRAARRSKRQLRGLQLGQWDLTFVDEPAQRLVTWWIAPEGEASGRPALVLLPDRGGLDRLPQDCQSTDRVREAAWWAELGYLVALPGLRGCDASDGLYLGSHHATEDIALTIAHIRREVGGPVAVVGEGSAGLLALQIALAGVPADAFVVMSPDDPAERAHLPSDHVAARSVAPRLSDLPESAVVLLPHPRLVRALREAGREVDLDDDDIERAVVRAVPPMK